jgi:hypothetical protein
MVTHTASTTNQEIVKHFMIRLSYLGLASAQIGRKHQQQFSSALVRGSNPL